MALTNTKERYGSVAQILHWLTALLIIGLLIAGTVMTYLPDLSKDEVALKIFVYSMHKTLGVTVFAIAVIRVIWAITNPRPKPLHPERKLETLAAETIHWALYIAILLMPVTGLLHHAATTGFAPIWWPFGQDLPFVPKDELLSKVFGAMHWAFAVGIAGSLTLHVAGAIKHARIDKDETVARMVPGKFPADFKLSAEKLSHQSSWLPAILAVLGIAVWVGGVGFVTKQQNTVEIGEMTPMTIDTEAEMTGDHMWAIIPAESALKIRIMQLGSPVEGEFKNWTAKINFDPENVDTAFVDARIDMTSLTLGSVSDQAKSADFLNVTEHPQARFLSDFFWRRGDGRYEAEGLLEIMGQKQPFTLIFALNFVSDDRVQMQALTGVNRMDYAVGAEKYGNEESVAFPVDIAINITAEREK